MSTFFLVVGSVMALVLGAAGAVALVTGRIVLPWFQGGVSRPGLWGAGALLLAGGLAATRRMPSGGNMPLVLVGLSLMTASQLLEEPRRTRSGRAAGSANRSK
ncbi:hypothetical protein JL475_21895 [Streptomyces sp. M2CJ-2]|uniref:hypothetical protein n=1 Tax=Streptomyces sp. M2CJ-2 TaxID=2803948 RepID=UPI001925448A|nr:hypothetical protein [Streptomyces sp. M2CJ-2]MBL3668594.1 hypothetical protein [Streptomyces sp. M2CJ-2]